MALKTLGSKFFASILMVLLTPAVYSITAKQAIDIIDKKFHYPQNAVKKGFKLRMYYTGAEDFIKAKIRKGETSGKYYVSYNKKTNKVSFDVSSISPRLSGAVKAILQEHQESIFPPSLAKSVKGYKINLVKRKKKYVLIAFIPKSEFLRKKRLPPVVRVEYYLSRSFRVERTFAYLHSGEKIDAKWTLQKTKSGKFLIKTNQVKLLLNSGVLKQTIQYKYKNVRGVYLPTKVTMASSFNGSKRKVETIKFFDHTVY